MTDARLSDCQVQVLFRGDLNGVRGLVHSAVHVHIKKSVAIQGTRAYKPRYPGNIVSG